MRDRGREELFETGTDWGEEYQRLTLSAARTLRYSVVRGGTGSDHVGGRSAEDFAAEAVVAILTGRHAWDPERQSLRQALHDALRRELSNALRSHDNRHAAYLEDRRHEPPAPSEAVLLELRIAADRIGGDEGALLHAMVEGYLAPRDAAERLGWTAERVSRTKTRLRRDLDRRGMTHGERAYA